MDKTQLAAKPYKEKLKEDKEEIRLKTKRHKKSKTMLEEVKKTTKCILINCKRKTQKTKN